MKLAYVDTSFLLAIAFNEPAAVKQASRLREFDRLFSSNLLEAEFRAALTREGIREQGRELLEQLTWVYPNRSLSREFGRVLESGYLKGADLWHLACALFLGLGPRHVFFLTLDSRQREVATILGFSAQI